MIQAFIGLGWLRAGVEKVISPQWWSGAELTSFLAEHEADTLPFYSPFLDVVVAPNAALIAALVLVLQLGLAGALLSGRNLAGALALGIFLNLNFIAAGAVDPSIFYIVAQGAVLLWIAERRRGRAKTRETMGLIAIGGAALAGVSAPFISTLDPGAVVEDPAIILVTAGSFAALSCCEILRRPFAARRQAERVRVLV